jgi:hypothetical protein
MDLYQDVDAPSRRRDRSLETPLGASTGRRGGFVTSYSDITVKAPVANVQNLVQQAFVANGFGVKWENPTKGLAEKGSKGANIMLGVLAQYYGIQFEIHPQGEASTLRLHKENTGWVGGYFGARKVEKQFDQVSDTLASWFNQQGILQGVRKQ